MGDWVVRHSFPGKPGRMDDCRRPQERVRRCGRPSGGRPPGCPLAPSSRQARVSIWDGCPGGCPSGCPAVGSEWESDRPSCLEGAGEQDKRVLAIGEAALGPATPAVATYRGNLGQRAAGPWGSGRCPGPIQADAHGQRGSAWPRPPDRGRVTALRDNLNGVLRALQEATLKVQPRLSSVVTASGRTQPTARAASLMPKHTCFLRSSSSTCAGP
jgi:hypothetical protein